VPAVACAENPTGPVDNNLRAVFNLSGYRASPGAAAQPGRRAGTGPRMHQQGSGMIQFTDDDQGYLAWIADHPDDFVINTPRVPKHSYVRLHRADCRLLSGVPANGVHWTRLYTKICGKRPALESWAQETVGVDPSPCARCL
jgi:hypothetical protein